MSEQEVEELIFDMNTMKKQMTMQGDFVNSVPAHKKKEYLPMLLTIQICGYILKTDRLEKEIIKLKQNKDYD